MKKITSSTDTKFIDPLSRKEINIDDRVTVTAPSGAIVDFLVNSINQDNTIVLGPLSKNKFKSLARLDKMKIGDVVKFDGKFVSANKQLQLKQNDMVTVTDKNGNEMQLKVFLFYGRDYLVLVRPGAPKLGAIDVLKFGWKLYWQ